ncbi:MAG TPA: TonB-dependent receptor [Chitinophagaceae bacterium]|nr:TonB-dependent receptor [Chitinophagaceae bacterium]
MVRTRLLLLFLLASMVCQAQTILKMPVSLQRQTGTVGEFLDELNKLPGITISYSTEVVDLQRRVQLSGQEKTVEDYLRSILKQQALRFVEQNGKVFLVPETPVKKKYTVRGYITDSKSDERLIGASIYIPSKKAGTTSNTYGFFSITLEQDSLEILTTYAGYFPKATPLNLQGDVELNIAMERNVVTNEMVVVNAEGKKNTHNRTLTGKTDVSSSLIKSSPALMGEADVLKTLQLLPGIQAGNEGSNGMNVRGGSADQNLILLDGVPVYNASHAFGLFSIFNADAVNNIEVLKSGFPASYGGRLSSVIDVHMKEGDKYKLHGEGGIGLVFSKFTLEGPLKRGRSSFLLSARRTYADLFIRPIMKLSKSGTDVIPFFGDISAKANFPVGEKNRFYLSAYLGQDKLHVKEDYSDSKYRAGFSWGNITAMTRWNHVFNKKTFSNFTFTYSRFRFNTVQTDEQVGPNPAYGYKSDQRYVSGINDWSLKGDIDYLPSPDHFVKAGFALILHKYHPGLTYHFEKDSANVVNSQLGNQSLYSSEYDVYVEDDIRLSSKMKANIGVRFSAFALKGKSFPTLQPRLNWLYKLTGKWSLKASYGKMNQFIHLLTNSTVGLPTDLWVPVTPTIPPQVSHQFSGGASYTYDRSLEFSVEAYYKTLKNVIDYGERSGFNNTTYSWEEVLEIGKGRTYGIECFAQKKKGKFTGLASYTLSRSWRQFDEINDGKIFPFKYDRRHEIKIAAIWRRSDKFELAANWFFSTGNAISLPASYYFDPFTRQYVDIYDGRNNSRMPDYHRLDVSLRFIKQKRKYLRTWVVSLYNAYNRFNPFFRYKTYEHPDNKIVFRDFSAFPFLPSISYQFKF